MNEISETEAELTPEYIRDLIDAEATRRLGMHVDELLARYRSGKLDDPGRVADLLTLAELLQKPAAA